jgi:hypothetical protein
VEGVRGDRTGCKQLKRLEKRKTKKAMNMRVAEKKIRKW